MSGRVKIPAGQLNHTGVVRRLTVLGQTHGGSFSAQVNARVAAEWKRQNLQAVVFVQDRKTALRARRCNMNQDGVYS